MKLLFWVGVLLAALGLISLVVPIPHTEREGVSFGGMSMGVKTQHSETVSPIISAAMIIGGVGLMVAGTLSGKGGKN
jgi:biopolymer transport protein ExbB/TolQ